MHAADTAVLDRPAEIDDDGPILLLLVDRTGTEPVRLAETLTREVLGRDVSFLIARPGRATEITLDDDGDPLYRFPRPSPPVVAGDTVVVTLPTVLP